METRESGVSRRSLANYGRNLCFRCSNRFIELLKTQSKAEILVVPYTNLAVVIRKDKFIGYCLLMMGKRGSKPSSQTLNKHCGETLSLFS